MSVAIIGGGLAGLVAAYRLGQQGEQVTVFEASDQPGGMISPVTVGDVTVDAGAEGYSTRTQAPRRLCEELGLNVANPSGSPHVWWPDRVAPLADGVMGIPASLDDPACTVLTADERDELARDLALGPEIGSGATTVGDLVSARMGDAAVTKLVAPLTKGVYGAAPEQVALATFAPRLLPALAEHGSLLAAVAALRAPGAAVEQPVGGMFRLTQELAARVDLKLGTEVQTLERTSSGWVITANGVTVNADRVIVATGATAARALVGMLGATFDVPPARESHVVMLASNHPDLAPGPIGSGILMGQPNPDITAKALTHYSRKWPWCSQEVLRLSYGTRPTRQQAIADASALTKLDLEGTVTDVAMSRWDMPGRIDPATREAAKTAAVAVGVELIGAWIDGNGIGPVIDAVEAMS